MLFFFDRTLCVPDRMLFLFTRTLCSNNPTLLFIDRMLWLPDRTLFLFTRTLCSINRTLFLFDRFVYLIDVKELIVIFKILTQFYSFFPRKPRLNLHCFVITDIIGNPGFPHRLWIPVFTNNNGRARANTRFAPTTAPIIATRQRLFLFLSLFQCFLM